MPTSEILLFQLDEELARHLTLLSGNGERTLDDGTEFYSMCVVSKHFRECPEKHQQGINNLFKSIVEAANIDKAVPA